LNYQKTRSTLTVVENLSLGTLVSHSPVSLRKP